MDRFDRIYALDRLLRQTRRPVSAETLQAKLECSRATLFRAIEDMRDHLGAPLAYDRALNGYHYDTRAGEHPYELPGLWFNASELYALLVIQRLLANLQPGLLERDLAPLRARIEKMLGHESLKKSDIADRVRILHIAARPTGEHFSATADALMRRRRLRIAYHGRERDTVTERDVSPQRLIHYRDNWYLDAWCHRRDALRSFSIDRIRHCRILVNYSKEIGQRELDNHFASAYGIFAGEPKHTAVLRFSARAARWVADEHWHPAQKGQFLADSGYELHVPYGDSRELVMDILRYGPEVEVIGPKALRAEVAERLGQAAQRYR